MTNLRSLPQDATQHEPPPLTEASIARSKAWQLSQQSALLKQERVKLARLRLAQLAWPDAISRADEENVNRWAQRFVVATERTGPHAMTEAKARKVAVAHVRMCQQEDAAADRPTGDHFEAGLKAYHAVLEGLPVTEPEAWHSVRERDQSLETISYDWYCPTHYPVAKAERELPDILPGQIEATKTVGDKTIVVRQISHPLMTGDGCFMCDKSEVE